MPEVSVSESLPVPVEQAWALVSDLSRYAEWLSLLEAWRGEVPAELATGIQVSAVVKAKGVRNRVTFEVTEFDPPHRIALVGEGVGGTRVAMTFKLSAAGSGSKVDFDVDFKHPALKGPMGSIAGRTIKGDLAASLERLHKLL